MRAASERRRQRGSISPMVAFSSIILAVMGVGGATIGQLVIAKQDAQQAADSAALASADAVREAGRAVSPQGAYAMGDLNAPAAIAVNRVTGESPGRFMTRATATTEIDAPKFIFPSGRLQVRAQATARINQERKPDVDDVIPYVTLVLDYSGSMSGGNIQTLEQAVREEMLDRDLGLEFSAVLFESQVRTSISFGVDAVEQILQAFTAEDAGGGTATHLGLDEARTLMEDAPPDRPRFVIVVSDGAPNDAGSARTAAGRIWDEAGARIITLMIGSGGRDFMVSISGPPEDRGNEDDYYEASDLESFRAAIAEILSSLNCETEPVDIAAVEDCSTVRVFLEGNGQEVPLDRTEDLASMRDQFAFSYNCDNGGIRFTPRTCEALKDSGFRIVVRYNRSRLIQ